ncbi:MAG TPA: PAS domain-containing protein, partial [Longimicrobiales bacterium]|nr:PAS domain-containing protein [Longimicrobiales bacterium]
MSFDPGLLALSILIALAASYAALDLIGALAAARGRSRLLWLGAGALGLGIGIWSMHFVGMLGATREVARIAWYGPLLFLSLALPIAAMALALALLTRSAPGRGSLVAGAVLVAAALVGTHYAMLASMRMPGATRWQPALVAASVAVALLAALVPAWFAAREASERAVRLRWRLGGALVLGAGLVGTHHAVLGAMRLVPRSGVVIGGGPGARLVIGSVGLAAAVALAALIILAITIAGSSMARALARRLGLAVENERLFRAAELERAEAEVARTEAERARADAEAARIEAEHARTDAERRATEEQVLRRATRELGLTEDARGLAEGLVRSALALARADGAWVEARDRHGERAMVEVVAVHGEPVPARGMRVPYPGSLTEEIIESGVPAMLLQADAGDAGLAPYLREACIECAAMAVPLIAGGTVEGALVLLRRDEPFREEEARVVAPLADTAAAAMRRVGLTEALRESEQRLRQLAENIREVFWVIDLDTRCMAYVSPAYEQIWGRSRKELFSDALAFTRSVHPEDRAFVDQALTERLLTGEYDIEYRIIRPDGQLRWIHSRGSPVRDAGGRLFRVAGIAEDVTARKEVEHAQRFLIDAGAALASSLDYHETLRVTARQAVPHVADWCAIDVLEDGEIRRVAAAHADPEREALATEVAARYPVDPDEPTGVANVLRTGEPELVRSIDDNLITVLARDGEHLRMLRELGLRSGMIVPMNARGRTLGAITLVAAESGRQYDEKDLELAGELAARAALAVDNARLFREAGQRRAELERVMESRARLMRGFSHDLKNPIGAADGYAQLLEDGMYGELNEQQRHSVGRLRTALAGALRLITDLLELARAESGEVEVRPQPTDLGRTILETVADYQAQAEAARLSLEVEVCDELPVVVTDANRARQVLGNLLSNAVKYTPAGGAVKVRVCEDSNGQAPAPGSWVRVDVSDDGPGIPRDKQDVVFEEFQRL